MINKLENILKITKLARILSKFHLLTKLIPQNSTTNNDFFSMPMKKTQLKPFFVVKEAFSRYQSPQKTPTSLISFSLKKIFQEGRKKDLAIASNFKSNSFMKEIFKDKSLLRASRDFQEKIGERDQKIFLAGKNSSILGKHFRFSHSSVISPSLFKDHFKHPTMPFFSPQRPNSPLSSHSVNSFQTKSLKKNDSLVHQLFGTTMTSPDIISKISSKIKNVAGSQHAVDNSRTFNIANVTIDGANISDFESFKIELSSAIND
ncbi:MAG: hypothetical protein ACRC9L_02075 [Brevinema sp.]